MTVAGRTVTSAVSATDTFATLAVQSRASFGAPAQVRFGRGTDDPDRFDLALEVDPVDSTLTLVFSTDRFERETVDRWLQNLAVHLEALLEHPDQPVGTVAWLGPAEREALARAHDTRHPFAERSLPAALAPSFRAHPDRIALRDPDRSWTYGEVWRKSHRVANLLRAGGSFQETWSRSTVGGRSSCRCCCSGSCWPVGPTSRSSPNTRSTASDRPCRLRRDAGPHRRAGGPRDPRRRGGGPPRRGARPPGRDRGRRGRSIRGARPTSSSPPAAPDGRRGAMNAHRAIVHRLEWGAAALGLSADDVFVLKTPFGFDVRSASCSCRS